MFASALFPSRASSSTSHPATHASPRRRRRAPLRRYFYVFDRTLSQLSPHHSPLSSEGCPLGRPGFVLLPISCLIVSPSASPTLPPTVRHASPHRRQRFLPLSLTLHSVVAHTTPPVTHLHRRPRFPPVAHASSLRRPRLLPPSPTLPPTVALASSHRRPRFLPPSPTLPPTVAHAFPHRRPRFPPPSPMAGGGAALERSVGRTARAARASGQQGVQCCRGRVRGGGAGEAGVRERGRPPLPLSSSLPPSIPHSLPHYPLSPFCCPFSLPSSRPPFLPFSLSSSSLDRVPLSLSISHSSTPFLTPTLLLRSTLPLIRLSSQTAILSSAHPLIRPSSHPPILSFGHPLIPLSLIRPSSHPPFSHSAFILPPLPTLCLLPHLLSFVTTSPP
ncbi:unnamed protein product [Closterium sp. NIES-65]|nr:unnamed protein product [Closterium sp. NIES-65]